MKKKFVKKLTLHKETISRLQNEEMRVIKGASLVIPTCECDTDSCSIPIHCCDTETKEEFVHVERNAG